MSLDLVPPVVAWAAPDDPERPLVLLLHGRGADESSIIGLARLLPPAASYAALRAPLTEGGGFAWFANGGIGRPLPDSLSETTAWARRWLDEVAPEGRPVLLVGFSGGAAFAGGLLLDDPARFAGTAVLYGTLPFDAGLSTAPGRLEGSELLVIHGDADVVIPSELQERSRSYAAGESGARARVRRLPGGHGISEASLEELRGWLESILEGIAAT